MPVVVDSSPHALRVLRGFRRKPLCVALSASPRLCGKIIIRAWSTNSKVHIDIEDTGIGISGGDLNRVFDPFFTTKEPGKGTGLGLFIVRQIVERNNGNISVKSEPGKGTTFTLEFHAVKSEEQISAGHEVVSRGRKNKREKKANGWRRLCFICLFSFVA